MTTENVRIERETTSIHESYDHLQSIPGYAIREYIQNETVRSALNVNPDKVIVSVQSQKFDEDLVLVRVGSPRSVRFDYVVQDYDVIIIKDRPKSDGI